MHKGSKRPLPTMHPSILALSRVHLHGLFFACGPACPLCLVAVCTLNLRQALTHAGDVTHNMSTRQPSATLSFLLMAQLQFLATLSLVDKTLSEELSEFSNGLRLVIYERSRDVLQQTVLPCIHLVGCCHVSHGTACSNMRFQGLRCVPITET